MMEKLVERFLNYVSFETTSDPQSESCPTTGGQKVLAEFIRKELVDIGMENVTLDDNGYLMAELSSNLDYSVPVLGFVAHMDTSPDMSGKNPKPRIVKDYDGADIVLSPGIVLQVKKFPDIKKYVGQDIIVTDGTSLLGADDKAGIAEIVTAFEYLMNHPEIPHGDLRLCFTPDEEVGRGADAFDVKKFGADYAYTVDGGEIGELEYENFNAASVDVTVRGTSVHPGRAKDRLVNSMVLAMEFHRQLPDKEVPEHTEKYQGFYHLNNMEGGVEETHMHYIIRDHDRTLFESRKATVEEIVRQLNEKYGEERFVLAIKDTYYNMKEMIEPNMFMIDKAVQAMEKAGITALIQPIRGGTDGARLSFMGLPTPNFFTGGHNFHGKFEYIPIPSMKKAVEVIINLAENFSGK